MFEDEPHTAPPGDDPTPSRGGNTASFGDPDDPPPPEPPPGYELLGVVGRGGMGIVYRARDTALDRVVAVKLLRDRFPPGGVEAQRFVQEARITSQLQHPGVPPVHEVGAFPDGRPFLVMKLVKGRTLQQRLRARAPGDRGRLIAHFEQVCQAVGYAHSHGVIHRDLKPSNVMIGKFGEVQVMDWGLAKSLDDPPAPAPPGRTEETRIRSMRDPDSATRTGSVLGTPAFMPPEQAGSELDKIDARSDVFGLGAVLCAILTGRPPYVADNDAALCLLAIRGKLDGAFARLDACGAEPDLVALCKRCLAPERDDRPKDANEVAEAVARVRTAAEERARAAELARVRLDADLREQRYRRRVRVAVAAAALAALAGGAAFAWWADRQETERREADLRAQLADERAERERREREARNAGAVAQLLTECEAALRADDPEAAALVFEQARARAAEGGADHLADRLARCGAELTLLLDLNRLDPRWTVTAGRLRDWRAPAKELAEALARYGIVPGATPPAEVAERVRDSLVRDHVLTALDRLLEGAPSPAVLELLRAVDPDPFRDAVRAAVAARDVRRVHVLAGTPEALAQPPRYAAVLGDTEAVQPVHRRRLLRAALDRRPGDYRMLMSLGYLSLVEAPDHGREYERWFRAAVAVRPDSPVAHNYLGLALLNTGDEEGALAEFRTAIRLDPRYAGAHNNLGSVSMERGDLETAESAFRSAVRWFPDYALANANLGELLEQKGDAAGAARHYGEWVRLAPDSAPALGRLARVLATAPDPGARDGRRAVELATRACDRTDWKDAAHIDTLAAALAEAGEFGRAVAEQKRALALAPSDAGARHRLALYERNRPYRAPPVAPRPREK